MPHQIWVQELKNILSEFRENLIVYFPIKTPLQRHPHQQPKHQPVEHCQSTEIVLLYAF